MPSDDSLEETIATAEPVAEAPVPVPVPEPLPVPEASPAVEEPSTSDLAAIVERWWADRMPGSPLARSTEAYNHVYEALADLKARLKGAR